MDHGEVFDMDVFMNNAGGFDEYHKKLSVNGVECFYMIFRGVLVAMSQPEKFETIQIEAFDFSPFFLGSAPGGGCSPLFMIRIALVI